MVGFSSGGENPHGVRAVTRGQRCAVALWFTLDPLYRELVSIAITVIESLHLSNDVISTWVTLLDNKAMWMSSAMLMLLSSVLGS